MLKAGHTVSEAIQLFKKELNSIYDVRECNSIVNLLFQEMFMWNKIDLRLNAERVLSLEEVESLQLKIRRLINHEPIQHVIGFADFYDLRFKVSPDVLIPRQETEELVDLILKETPNRKIRILDIGSGSGCIAIALKKHLPLAEIISIDISEKAIKIAKENSQLNEAEIDFRVCDVFSDNVLSLGPFDIIVSNPPYITEKEEVEMLENVLKFEPHIALFVNKDAMEFYKRIVKISSLLLKSNGQIFFELNEHYKNEYQILFDSLNVKSKFIEDINGKARIAKVC